MATHSQVEIPLLGDPSPPITNFRRRRIWIAATVSALLCLGPILVIVFDSGDGNQGGIRFGSTEGPEIVESEVGVVAADDWRCSNIGVEALRAGGHAVDAAVAAALCLGIVHPFSSGIGGGAFMVAWPAGSSSADTYDSRETAPAAASEVTNFNTYVLLSCCSVQSSITAASFGAAVGGGGDWPVGGSSRFRTGAGSSGSKQSGLCRFQGTVGINRSNVIGRRLFARRSETFVPPNTGADLEGGPMDTGTPIIFQNR
ncbi:Gamma-glutamyltranspeptidase 3 [Platanthera guangdongensis]|uniref:Gamma-glutamyltranspeptidase 3 n=1 Tax=Platanthera guangdongensis TaxID=2320717 RepID=A0ABR2M6M0_9ASPA